MCVRMPGVEVINRHPIEFGVEVLLHLSHQIAEEWLEIAQLGAVLGRDNETELVGIALRALQESDAVDIVPPGIVEAARVTFPSDPVALNVAQMRTSRSACTDLLPCV